MKYPDNEIDKIANSGYYGGGWGQILCGVIILAIIGGYFYGLFSLNSYIRETFDVGFILADYMIGMLFIVSLIAIVILILPFVYLKDRIHKKSKGNE